MTSDDREASRLAALYRLNLLDTHASENFDRITRTISQLFDLPISAISLTDTDRQWFKSRLGVEHSSLPRLKAPCSQVTQSNAVLVINDLIEDPLYADSTLTSEGIRFYAGAPLTTPDGYTIGALCVLGKEPRPVTNEELRALTDTAAMVMSQIELQQTFGRIDPVSALPNRTQFYEDIHDLCNRPHEGRRFAVLVDLARNEQISNCTRVMGANYVDAIIRETARLIGQTLGPTRTAYHVGFSQFAFLSSPGTAEGPYMQLLDATCHRLSSGSAVRFVMTAAIGVAPFVVGKCKPDDILRKAHSAVLDARSSGTNVCMYSEESDSAHRRQFDLLNCFGDALEASDQLRLVFQPRIDTHTRRCVGAEALLRWQHPTLGNIPPGEFIPIVEQTSLARPATAWVLDRALARLSDFHTSGVKISISVNVSASNLEEPDFAQHVQLLLLKHRVRPEFLELEVTESAIMKDGGRALQQLNSLHAAGIKLAIDDFGTGHSSLAYLQRLPVDVVKIDREFVGRLDTDKKQQTLVRSMIALTHELAYRVVAEGVETAESADLLSSMNCDELQGYFFARPLEFDDFLAWAQNDACAPAALRLSA